MPSDGKKNVSFKLDADLHAEVKAFIEQHEMTIGEFMALAIENELHPKIQVKEDKSMQNSRTIAFAATEEFYQRVKAYQRRNHVTQKDFFTDIALKELERDEALYESHNSGQDGDSSDEDEDEHSSQRDEYGGQGEDSSQSGEYGDQGEDSEQNYGFSPTM